jgi:hypothetical protein
MSDRNCHEDENRLIAARLEKLECRVEEIERMVREILRIVRELAEEDDCR